MRANFRSKFGSTRTNDTFRTATALENWMLPAVHICLRAARIAESGLMSPPADEVV
jgi:hypothetical protein